MSNLQQQLSAFLNRESAENESNTPDFILAQFLLSCLTAFNTATTAREKWYGVRLDPVTTPPKGEPTADMKELVSAAEYVLLYHDRPNDQSLGAPQLKAALAKFKEVGDA